MRARRPGRTRVDRLAVRLSSREPQFYARLVASLGLVLLGAAAQAPAAGASDLVVTSASRAPRSVDAGSRLQLRVAVANRGGGRAGKSHVGLYLSSNALWSSSDYQLGVAGRTRALGARRRTSARVRVRVPRGAPPAQPFKLLVCADARHEVAETRETNNCRIAGPLLVVGGSSFDVIDAAVTLHRLKPSQAVLYKLFAVFGDRRLPKRYRGDGTRLSGTSAVDTAMERFPLLPARIRAQVKPFLIPPGYKGSFARRGRTAVTSGSNVTNFDACNTSVDDWLSVETDNGAARIWWASYYPEFAPNAERLKRELDGTIWNSLTSVMGEDHKPLPDGAVKCGGPDSKLDVWLWPMTDRRNAITRRFAVSCKPTPAYIVMDPRGPRTTLAHEFMHVLQDTYDVPGCAQWEYVDDATATWAEDHAYHTDESEHPRSQLVETPQLAFGSGNRYAGWAFFFSATQHAGDSGPVRRLYEHGQSSRDPLDALNLALPFGLDEAWPSFAMDAWNRPLLPDALKESFFNWDRWHVRPSVAPRSYRLQGRRMEDPLPIELGGLTRQYYDLDFSDGTARDIKFKEPSPSGIDSRLRTWAFIKIARTGWRAEDWTGEKEVEYCRDDPAEDVREVVLVHSTTRRPPKSDPNSTVTKSDRPQLQLRSSCGVKAVLHIHGEDSYTVTTAEPSCGSRRGSATWQADTEFEIPRRFGSRRIQIDSVDGSGSGRWGEEHFDCPEAPGVEYPMKWEGGDDVRLKITPVPGGAGVELMTTPSFELLGSPAGGGWSPYFLNEECSGPRGFLTDKDLGKRSISISLSGNCDKTSIDTGNGDTEHIVTTAGGTLELHLAQ